MPRAAFRHTLWPHPNEMVLVERYPDLPVLAAGGITSGRALAAVLAAGAHGASLGTALLATPEAVEVPEAFKERVIQSDGQDTVLTNLYDLLAGRDSRQSLSQSPREEMGRSRCLYSGSQGGIGIGRRRRPCPTRPRDSPSLFRPGSRAIG